jgi:hypothetical protein
MLRPGRGARPWPSPMSATNELTLLCLVAAAAGGFALAADDLYFTAIFAAMSWVALGHVLRNRDR